MLTTETAARKKLRWITCENVAQMKISLSLPEADSFGKEALSKIRKNLHADDVVLGSYVPLGEGHIRVDLRLQNTLAGETLTAVSERGHEGQIDDLVARAGTARSEEHTSELQSHLNLVCRLLLEKKKKKKINKNS